MTTLAGGSTANGGTIITIPAGASWSGVIELSASLTNSVGSGAVQNQPTITLQGTGSEFASGTVLARLSLSCPAIGALALVGFANNDCVTKEVQIDNLGVNNVTLQLNHACTVASGVAIGRY